MLVVDDDVELLEVDVLELLDVELEVLELDDVELVELLVVVDDVVVLELVVDPVQLGLSTHWTWISHPLLHILVLSS